MYETNAKQFQDPLILIVYTTYTNNAIYYGEPSYNLSRLPNLYVLLSSHSFLLITEVI